MVQAAFLSTLDGRHRGGIAAYLGCEAVCDSDLAEIQILPASAARGVLLQSAESDATSF